MHESVSDVLVARARDLDDLGRPVTASFVVHMLALVTMALLPTAWFTVKVDKPMVISLGAGSTGLEKSGMTSLGGQKVEQVAPPKAHTEPIIPVQQKSTAMTEPTKTVKPTAPRKDQPSKLPTAAVTKPVTGAQVSQGNAVAATTAQGLGVGLSTGGQGGSSLDSNFCCPDWVEVLKARVSTNWTEHIGAIGTVRVRFVVQRDGRISNIEFDTKTGLYLLDNDAWRAVQSADGHLPPLPAAYEPNRLTVTLTFPYQR